MEQKRLVKNEGLFFFVCLGLGILAEELLFKGAIGVSGPFFIVVFYFVFFFKISRSRFQSQRLNLLIFLCVWSLGFSYMLYTNPILRGLNYLVIPLLIVIQITLSSSSKLLKWYKLSFIRYIFSKLRSALNYNQRFITGIFHRVFKGVKEETLHITKKILVGLCLAVPIGLVATGLLMSADLKFANLINQLPQWAVHWINQEVVARLLLILFITFGFFGYFKAAEQNGSDLNQAEAKLLIKWDGVVALIVLITLNGVYTLFSLIQFKYFFGQTLQGDLTYAIYARRGFAELVIVTVLNLTMLVSVLSFVKLTRSRLWTIIQFMLSLLVGYSGVLLASAYIRLSMYEEAYGFTMLRLLVQAFMIFLTLIFVYTLITIWLRQLSLVRFYLLSSLIFYGLINLVPLDQIVIENNLNRFEQSGKIDVNYLNRMSSSGVISLINLYHRRPDLPGLRETLESDKIEATNDQASWRSYNLEKQQANKQLKSLVLPK